ncbi:MAG: hypothetical protein WAM82_08810 [Thermoanaerobaculia bacterium]
MRDLLAGVKLFAVLTVLTALTGGAVGVRRRGLPITASAPRRTL